MRRFDLAVTCVCCALLGYFAWHAWEGPRGYPYLEGLQRHVASLESSLARHTQAREALEHRVSLLRPETIDPDLLDELARRQLDMTTPSDVIALTKR